MGLWMGKFKNIWEIESHFKCPVIGAMLSAREHKKVLVKCGVDVRGLKPYQHHQIIMERLITENSISVKVNHVLRNKARGVMKMVAAMDKDDFGKAWDSALEKGEPGPFMLAMASREDVPGDLLADIFGEMHMLEHSNMAGMVELRKELKKRDEKIKKLEKKLGEEKSKTRDAALRCRDMEDSLQKQQQENRELKAKGKDQSAFVDSCHCSSAETESLRGELASAVRRMQKMEREKRKLQVELFDSRSENRHLQGEMEELTGRVSAMVMGPCPGETGECKNTSCPEYRICARKILMVGGITKIKHLYRNLVESGGGQFDYHDGYMNNGSMNLEARIRRCDVVVCPVNCNSHAACLKVKKLCGKHGKCVKMLAGSSLSALSSAVFENGGDSRELNSIPGAN